jgi:hypothetical protein
MEKDMIRDQKVFVRLESVLALQKRYAEVATQYETYRTAISTGSSRDALARYTAEKRTIEQIIGILGLPIQKV